MGQWGKLRMDSESLFMKTKIFSLLLAVVFTLTMVTPANAATPDPGAIAADVLIGRPACLVATVLGSVMFVIALPVAATSGSIDSAADSLVVKPARATFVRPLGDWGYSDEYGAQQGKHHRLAKSSKAQRAGAKK